MVNLLPIAPDETIQTVMAMPADEESWTKLDIVFATASGNIRRNKLSDFTNIKRNGKIAMKLDEGDKLVGVSPCAEDSDILLASRAGKAIRFATTAVRVFAGRGSTGVRGIKLLGDDKVVSMSVISDESLEYVLSVTENGFGKRTLVSDYRRSGRGGQGVANIETTERNGEVVSSFVVLNEDQLMLVTDAGKIIRIALMVVKVIKSVLAGRKTQGVRLFEIGDDETVMSVGVIKDADDDEQDGESEGDVIETGAEAGDVASNPIS